MRTPHKTAPLLLVASVLPISVVGQEVVNHCHKPDVDAQWEQLLANSPKDPIVIRLYALRVGLCRMADEGLVDFEQAIDIFNKEHARGVMERMEEDNERRRERAL